MTESPIKGVRVCVPEPAPRVRGDIVQELNSRVTRERHWHACVDEWAAEIPLSGSVRDDMLAQLKALDWPEAAVIKYDLELTGLDSAYAAGPAIKRNPNSYRPVALNQASLAEHADEPPKIEGRNGKAANSRGEAQAFKDYLYMTKIRIPGVSR
jgi:hypothetical protein